MATRMKRKIGKDSRGDGKKKKKTEERKCYFTYGNDRTEEFLFNKRESLLHAYKRVQSPIKFDKPCFSCNGEPLEEDFILTSESIGSVFMVHEDDVYRDMYLFWCGGANQIKKKNRCLVHDFELILGLKKHVYIRKCYSELWKSKVWPYLQSEAQSPRVLRYLHITGTPGIGKTTFLLYILYKLKKLSKRVTFIHGSEIYVFNDHPRVLYYHQLDKSFFNCEGEIFISDPGDSILPAYSEICSRIDVSRNMYIILSSPDKKHIEHVKKIPRIKCVMPVWSWDEITACNERIYKKSENEVKDIYIRFSHTPRACFTFTCEYLEEELNKCTKNPKRAFEMIKQMFYESHSGKIEQYMMMIDKEKYDWATSYVKERFLSALPRIFTSFEHRVKLLESTSNLKLGDIYKVHVKNKLYKFVGQEGTQTEYIEAKSLEGRQNDISFRLPWKKVHILETSLDELKPEEGTIYVPMVKNFTCVDLILFPNILIHITIGASHKMTGIKSLIGKLVKKDWCFVFVIRKENFENFAVTSGKIFCQENNIGIYKMLIDFEEIEEKLMIEQSSKEEEREDESENESENESEVKREDKSEDDSD